MSVLDTAVYVGVTALLAWVLVEHALDGYAQYNAAKEEAEHRRRDGDQYQAGRGSEAVVSAKYCHPERNADACEERSVYSHESAPLPRTATDDTPVEGGVFDSQRDHQHRDCLGDNGALASSEFHAPHATAADDGRGQE